MSTKKCSIKGCNKEFDSKTTGRIYIDVKLKKGFTRFWFCSEHSKQIKQELGDNHEFS